MVNGGGSDIIQGGAVFSAGTLTLQDCIFNANRADPDGGAVYAEGHSLTINGCVFQANEARYGGAINANTETVSISNSTITGNKARGQGAVPGVTGDGGGIFLGEGVHSATISNTSVSGNTANVNGYGGGIYVSGGTAAFPTVLTLTGVTIASNHAGLGGGGLAIGLSSDCTVFMEDVVIAGNSASNGGGDSKGGGVYLGGGTLYTTNTLITVNSADIGGGLYQASGAVWHAGEGTAVWLNFPDDVVIEDD